MKRLVARVFAALALIFSLATAAVAEKRVALVIGNSTYAQIEKLKNPQNDARKLAVTLKSIGFENVTLKLDLGQNAFRRALRDFARVAAGADIALIYYAGHGIEVGGSNYLIPTDAELGHVDDLEFDTLPLDTLLSALNRAGKLKLVILDACRNNPFKNNMAVTGSQRSIGRGLARVSPRGSDTLVAYAAREGTVAEDGSGGNSPYASALIRHMSTTGLDVRLLFGRVRDDVLKSTGGRQEPFTYGSLGGTAIVLKPAEQLAKKKPDEKPEQSAKPKPRVQIDREALFWNSIKDGDSADAFKAYLDQFPHGTFASLAKIRIRALGSKLAALPPKQSSPAAIMEHDCDRLAAHPMDAARVGRGIRIDLLKPSKAIEACKEAVAQFPDIGRFNYQLGRAHQVAKQYDAARSSYLKAYDLEHAIAAFNLGSLYAKGQGVSKDYAEAVRWYRRGAEKGDAPAIHSLGYMVLNGLGVSKDYAEAVRWFRKAADGGYVRAMYNLGYMTSVGRGVSRDDAEAARWYRKAADKGYVPAMHALGSVFAYGKGVPQNSDEAVRWYRKAAEKGETRSMYILALLYDDGNGFPMDKARAARWYRKAAEKDHPDASYRLASMFANGLGVPRNKAEAIHFYRKAAIKGKVEAMGTLAEMLYKGEGGVPDNSEAAKWMLRAVKAGHSPSLRALYRNHQKFKRIFRLKIQEMLRDEGAYSGPIDGKFGPRTLIAIQAYAGKGKD